ncbi:hypothetical protein L208DRAFT_1377848 [Tricholoma matsutake]|nr:hypothetical protein L208DRAFT_1377848 [Tricholoma matsutake 945]
MVECPSSKTHHSQVQSPSRYFELDLSPILEDTWVFAGNSPRLGNPTTASPTIGLGGTLAIDSGLAGTSVSQDGRNHNIFKTRTGISGVVQSSSVAFMQWSSMSCSSFGELLEKFMYCVVDPISVNFRWSLSHCLIHVYAIYFVRAIMINLFAWFPRHICPRVIAQGLLLL